MALRVHRSDTVDGFLAAAGRFLAAREAENNVLLGITSQLQEHPEVFADRALSFTHVTDRRRVVAATLRVSPNNQALSVVVDEDAPVLLAEALRDEAIPGLVGPSDGAARFADRWSTLTGRVTRLEMAQRSFRLERVRPPSRPASGSWRLAEPRDRDLLVGWMVEFWAEAFREQPPPAAPGEAIDRMIARAGRTLYVWEDDDRLVSMAGVGGRTPNGVRIGPVYTPPALRGRGYGTSLTAAASQDQLDKGRRFVFLLTDLANPTSNHIYQAIGYEPVCDIDVYRFELDA